MSPEPKYILDAYTHSELMEGAELPERISSITHDVEVGEKQRLNEVLEVIPKVLSGIREDTDIRFVLLGSMGMYATLHSLRNDGETLMLLEQRISSGKNDFDIGVSPDTLNGIMSDLGWDESQMLLQRGKVVGSDWNIDVNGRRELPSFPWQEVQIGEESVLVQSPEEMIFEKINALVDPGKDDKGDFRSREVKWGVDIKILKAFLMIKNNFTESQLNEFLSNRWNEYTSESTSRGITEMVERVTKGEGVRDVLRSSLKDQTGESELDIEAQMKEIGGEENAEFVRGLINSSPEEFEENLKKLVDAQTKPLTYDEVMKIASSEYQKTLENK